MESGYDGIFKSLTKEKQTELIERKAIMQKIQKCVEVKVFNNILRELRTLGG